MVCLAAGGCVCNRTLLAHCVDICNYNEIVINLNLLSGYQTPFLQEIQKFVKLTSKKPTVSEN